MLRQVILHKTSKFFEIARVLDSSVIPAYQESLKGFDGKAKQTLDVFAFTSPYVEFTGSNPFISVHLQDSGLLPKGARLAGRKELEEICSINNSFFDGIHVDFGLMLKTAGDSHAPNDFLARYLTEELKQRGINLGQGKLIPLTALRLKEDSHSSYGLIFELNEKATKETIRNLGDFAWDYQRDEGLSRAVFFRLSGWGSYHGLLANSSPHSRVVYIK